MPPIIGLGPFGENEMKTSSMAIGFVLMIESAGAISQPHPTCTGPQIGNWSLQSYATTDLETGETTDLFGKHPTGYLSYSSDCRMSAIIVRDGRKAPSAVVPTDSEKIDLYSGVIAYAGTYDINGDKVSHHIDVSWNQVWTGTTQVRQFRVDGESLYIRTMPAKNPLTGRRSASLLIWIKVR